MALSTSSIVASVSLLHLAAVPSDLRKEHGCSIAKEASFASARPRVDCYPESELLNRTEMVPRGPSFGIGSAHAQNAPANRKNVRPTRDRACIARRPANSRYSDLTIDAVRCPFAPAIGIRRYTKLEPRALALA